MLRTVGKHSKKAVFSKTKRGKREIGETVEIQTTWKIFSLILSGIEVFQKVKRPILAEKIVPGTKEKYLVQFSVQRKRKQVIVTDLNCA